jgi:hypothetical protein
MFGVTTNNYFKKKVHIQYAVSCLAELTLILLMWRIWCASNNASRWQMGFNTVFKGLSLTNEVMSFVK